MNRNMNLPTSRTAADCFQYFIIIRPIRSRIGGFIGLALLSHCLMSPTLQSHAEDVPDSDALVAKAELAIQQRDYERALALLNQAVDAVPDEYAYRWKRAKVHDRLRQHELTVRDCDTILDETPNLAHVLDLRGSAKFKLGNVVGSIEDFDAAIKHEPRLEVRHWQRGISYYYAEQFEQGARQFELYQTFDGGDVENIVWRFICQARSDGVDQAREDVMDLEKPDARVPMAEIYNLFRAKGSIDEVLDAARKGDPDEASLKMRLFYAHLYIGLYCEATGQNESASHHLREADSRKISHYMWDVAHVHVKRLDDADRSE